MKKLFFIALVLIAAKSWAQVVEKPNHQYDFGTKINFMTLTDAGVLIVASNNGLSGINPDADKPHFNFTQYGKVKEEELEFVPNSPYVIVNQGGGTNPIAALTGIKKTVIDFISGKQLFATEENGWKTIAQLSVDIFKDKLIVVGNRNTKEKNMLAVATYQLSTGKQEFMVSLDPNAGKVSMGALPMSSGRPLLLSNMIFVPTTKKLWSFDLASGNKQWEANVDNLSWMSADASGKEIYGFEERPNGDTRIHKISSDGQLLWAQERKIKGKVTRFEILQQGLAIVSDVDNSGKSGIAKLASSASESKIGFLSAATGDDLWEKAPKTKGYVQHFYIMDDGILFGIESGGINKIAFDGTTLFKKPLQTGENIQIMASTPNGIIYITDTDANIIDSKSGESIWKSPIKYKKAKSVSSAYDRANKRYLISTGEEILAIDENTGNTSVLSKIAFKEKETPSTISIRNDGILLSSSQNMMLLDFNGKEKFHEYYKSPGQSGLIKVLSGTLAVASFAMANAAAYQGGRYGTYPGSNQLNSYGEQMKIQQEAFSEIASASFQVMNKRFKATAATENAQFILTSLDSGVGLVRVNKDSGKAEKEILLKDKKPEYKVDEQAGILYYKSADSKISAFKI